MTEAQQNAWLQVMQAMLRTEGYNRVIAGWNADAQLHRLPAVRVRVFTIAMLADGMTGTHRIYYQNKYAITAMGTATRTCLSIQYPPGALPFAGGTPGGNGRPLEQPLAPGKGCDCHPAGHRHHAQRSGQLPALVNASFRLRWLFKACPKAK
jgi:hypothetical protein